MVSRIPPGRTYDATVIGSGPNGLAAAAVMVHAGRSVLVLEAGQTVGGGMRTAELTLPGFKHDVCSAIHPMGLASPFFRSLPLTVFGLSWIHPPINAAHPLDDGTAAILHRSVDVTARSLGEDEAAYHSLARSLTGKWHEVLEDVLRPPGVPRHPIVLLRFSRLALRSATRLADRIFKGQRARALFAGMAAHSVMPLEARGSAAIGLALMITGHTHGWPLASGGSQSIADALARHIRSLGADVVTGFHAGEIARLPPSRIFLLDVTPRQLLNMLPDMPAGDREKLMTYHYGPAAFKVDWAMDGPIPWQAAECKAAGTVHVGGTFEEIAAAEREVWSGKNPERPFVLLAQQSLFDPTRAPTGKHTAWAYCHVPNGSEFDMTERIEAQIERFAPGFRRLILARSIMSPSGLETYNPNYVGGDIAGGANSLSRQMSRTGLGNGPYSSPVENVYLCSASTPPGAGVHGMCGYHAAKAALASLQSA